MKPFPPRLALAVALLSASIVPTGMAASKIEETIVAPAWEPGVILTLSPTGMHLASTRPKGSRFVVTVDGVDGEPFDEIYNAGIGFEQTFSNDGFFLRSSATWTAPVVFSRDGKRHAYAARRGKEVIVMLDGKEIFKAPTVTGKSPANNLFFSPDGKRLFFLSQTDDSHQSWKLMLDGQPATPAFEGVQFPTFSPDGSRWALVAPKPRQNNPSLLIIDGKDPGYFGDRVQFTPDNKRVVCVSGTNSNKQALLVDGKPTVSGTGITKVRISSTGDIGAIVVLAPGRHQFFLNGKMTLDTTSDFVFSPNGKRWAAMQGFNRQFSVVVDGQKESLVTPGPQNLRFSPDSTRVVYVVERPPSWTVVVDGKESEEYRVLDRRPLFGESGNGFIYVGGFMIGKMKVHFNDHVEPEEQRPAPAISPDGKRFAYFGKGTTNDPNWSRLIVDKEMKMDARGGNGTPLFFSPDSKHLAVSAHTGLWYDDTFVKVTHGLHGFTRDSRNLVLSSRQLDAKGQNQEVYYVNGDAVARFSPKGMQFSGTRPKEWEELPDGRLVFVGHIGGNAPDVAGGGYGVLKRITVTPDPAGSATAWVASVAASEKAAIAAAAAKKKQAEDDAVAAAAKKKADAAATAAKRKADLEAAAAKRKADLEKLKKK